MEVSIRRTFPNDMFNFVVDITTANNNNNNAENGDGRRRSFAVHTLWVDTEDYARKWVMDMQKKIRKQRPIIVALCADRSYNYADSGTMNHYKREHKDREYDLLQICIEDQCLVVKLDRRGGSGYDSFNCKALKEFLLDHRVTVVGVGLENLVERFAEDYGWEMPKIVDLRDLWAQAQAQSQAQVQQVRKNLNRFGIARLAKVVLGEEMNLVKPAKIQWWCRPYNYNNRPRFHSDEVIKYATVEAFLVFQMGTKLILEAKN
ncbi:uncharacterized protein LOC115700805 [Cannabis sativa]|uniref:Uncharacterized protein n=1 Tax=Cannabis sativa TaxID=3483 RepID=A0A7J6HPL9_CANSA|nr:uncharacterized protein LOC115700805 [Cannabis sativa]KAF4396821.1 hypothetical protein F8388_004789 [Cannabis sativa]